jgi:hypothetical protein
MEAESISWIFLSHFVNFFLIAFIVSICETL